MRVSAKAAVVVPVLALASALVACGSSSPTTSSVSGSAVSSSAAAPAAAKPANPVTVVRETGATVQPGEVYGSTTVDGWLSADGSFSASGRPDAQFERVTLYTLPPGITGQQAIAQVGATSSDSQVLVAGVTSTCSSIRPRTRARAITRGRCLLRRSPPACTAR